MGRIRRSIKGWRDTVLFIAGLLGIGNESFSNGTERPTLLILFASMIGLPAFLRSDEALKKNDNPDPVAPSKAPVEPSS